MLFDLYQVEISMLWKEKIMEVSTRHLVLAPDAAIDLQLHTTYSDGTWTPEQLIDYLVHEQFGLAAITDPEPPGASRYPDLIGNPRIGNLTLDFDGTLIYP